MKRRIRPLLVAAGVVAATLVLPGSVRAHADLAPGFLGAFVTSDSPYAVAVNSEGDVWATYADTPRIARFDTAGHQQLSIALDPSDSPTGVAVDAAGNAYVTDANNSTVLKYSRAGSLISTWSNVVGAPVGIALDSAGNVFVTDGNSDQVIELNASGGLVASFDGGHQLSPQGLAADAAGNVYVTDLEANQIYKLTPPAGSQTAVFGSGFGSNAGQFDLPAYDAVDSGGNVIASDENNNRIQEFTSSGQLLNAWGSGGNGNGEFTNPLGVAVDVAGNVYVADEGNARIQKFFTGINPCANLFSPHLSACTTAKTACMAKLVPSDEAACLNSTNSQYEPFRGQHAATQATITPSRVEGAVHMSLRVRLTASGSPAAGRTVRLLLRSLRPTGLTALHLSPKSAVTDSNGTVRFTITASRSVKGTFNVSVIDVTDGTTFANRGTIAFG